MKDDYRSSEEMSLDRDELWISAHLGDLMKQYAGLYVAVVDEQVAASGPSAKQVEQEAIRKSDVKSPSVVLVPRKGDLVHVLSMLSIR